MGKRGNEKRKVRCMLGEKRTGGEEGMKPERERERGGKMEEMRKDREDEEKRCSEEEEEERMRRRGAREGGVGEIQDEDKEKKSKRGVERDEEEWRAKGKDGGSWRKGKRKNESIEMKR